jgi:putative sugar O-methyltransferase
MPTEEMQQIGPGQQWTNIVERLGKQEFNIESFRSARDFFMFSTFDPNRFGLLYLRTLIWTLYRTMDVETRAILGQIRNRQIGNPHTILVDGEQLDLDYVVSACEARFVLEGAKSVSAIVEIGAGYGRTCHSLLSVLAGVERYWILDLPFMLNISRQYLFRALPPQLFAKISFVDVTQAGAIDGVSCEAEETLAINIDSLAEMDLGTVRDYLRFIDANAAYFYSNNTLGKYRPEDVGEQSVRKKDAEQAVRSGPLPHAIPIFDIDGLATRFDAYHAAYLPGSQWSVLAEADAPCYPHYRQIIYRRDSREP